MIFNFPSKMWVRVSADPPLIGGDIVGAVGRDRAEVRINEIIDANFLRLSFWLPFLATVLEIAAQFLLLGVAENHRIPNRLVLRRPASDLGELGVPVRMVAAFPGLAGRLETVAKVRQKVTDTPLADLVALLGQFLRKPRRALARPAQRRLRIASGLNQGIKVAQKALSVSFLRPPPAARMRRVLAAPTAAGRANEGGGDPRSFKPESSAVRDRASPRGSRHPVPGSGPQQQPTDATRLHPGAPPEPDACP